MNDTEKLSMIKSIMGISASDTSEDSRITVFLSASAKEILAWRYSYSDAVTPVSVVPSEYETVQVFSVVTGYSQSGAENQTGHSENGISRTFKYEDMIAYIRAHVIPIAKVM